MAATLSLAVRNGKLQQFPSAKAEALKDTEVTSVWIQEWA
jgi:hypothetical protein